MDPAENRSAALAVEDLTVTYPNGHQALCGVSLVIGYDARLGVVGGSGSGKTTLLRAIMGLLPPSSSVEGRVVVDGTDLLALAERERRRLYGQTIGFVAQDPFAACDPLRRVRHHIEEPWLAHAMKVPAGRVVAGLATMGIEDPAERSRQWPHEWSGGMLQRATVLAATAHAPLVTLADEPTSALDTELADDALDLLYRTCSALLLVTHDLALASRHTDDVVVLDAGRIVERGRSDVVLSEPTHETTRRLIRAAVPLRRAPGGEPRDRPVILRAEGVSKSYRARGGRTVDAVQPTSLDVRSGEVIGIVGRSGSGKSTMLRLLAGIERPDSGSVMAGDDSIWGPTGPVRMPRRGFAMPVLQDPVASLDQRWPLWRTLTEPLVIARGRMSRLQRRRIGSEQLASLGLHDIDVERLPSSLSVGQCQRVAILRALIADPALVVADEPTASLDVEAAAAVSGLLRQAADRGAAVVVVSHDEARLRSYADRIMQMVDGDLRDAEQVEVGEGVA